MPKPALSSRTIKRAFLDSTDDHDHQFSDVNKMGLPPAVNQPLLAKPPSKAAKRSRRKLLRNVEEMLSGRVSMEAIVDKPSLAGFSSHNQNVDITAIQEELSLAKKKLSQSVKHKTLLQAQNVRLDKEIQKQGRQIDQLLKSSIDNSSGNFDRTGILEALRQEKCKVTGLQAKMQSLEADKTALENKLETISASLKFSAVRELRVQNRAYYMEARRLRVLALKVSSSEKVIEQDLQKRLEQRTGIIQTQMEQDRSLLTEQIKSLEATITELRHKSVSLTISLEDGSIERASLLNQIDQLGKEKERILNQNSEVNKRIEDMQQVLDTEQSDISELRARCEEQQLQLESRTAELVTERNASLKLSEKIVELSNQQAALAASCQSQSEQLQVTLADREAAAAALRQESDSRLELIQNFERAKLQLQKEQENSERLQHELNEREKQADALREQAAKESSIAEAYKAESEKLTLELQEVRYHESSLQDQMKTTMEQSQLQIEQLQSSLNMAEGAGQKVHEIQALLEAKQQELASLQMLSEEQKRQLEALSSDLESEKKSSSKLAESVAELTREQYALATNYQIQTDQLQVALAERDAAKQEIEIRQEASQNLDRIQSKLQEEHEACERLQSNLNELQKQSDNYREQAANESLLTTTLKAELEKASSDLQNSHQPVSSLQEQLKQKESQSNADPMHPSSDLAKADDDGIY